MKRALDIPNVPHNLTVTAIVRRLEISVTYRIKIDYHIKQITKLCFSFQAFLFFFGAVARWDGVEGSEQWHTSCREGCMGKPKRKEAKEKFGASNSFYETFIRMKQITHMSGAF